MGNHVCGWCSPKSQSIGSWACFLPGSSPSSSVCRSGPSRNPPLSFTSSACQHRCTWARIWKKTHDILRLVSCIFLHANRMYCTAHVKKRVTSKIAKVFTCFHDDIRAGNMFEYIYIIYIYIHTYSQSDQGSKKNPLVSRKLDYHICLLSSRSLHGFL